MLSAFSSRLMAAFLKNGKVEGIRLCRLLCMQYCKTNSRHNFNCFSLVVETGCNLQQVKYNT